MTGDPNIDFPVPRMDRTQYQQAQAKLRARKQEDKQFDLWEAELGRRDYYDWFLEKVRT